jgi:hypothetical protein
MWSLKLSAPLEHFGCANETGEGYIRIVCRPAFRLQSGDESALALDERFNFTDLVIQFRNAIGLHRVSMSDSTCAPLM